MRRPCAVLLCLAIAVVTRSAILADPAGGAESPAAAEARETFQSLFAKDVAKARATPASDDDLAVAKRLLAVARDATASSAFLAILCDEAYALAAPHAAGEATAAGAMHLLAEHVPDRAEEAKQRLASLRGEPAEPAGEEESKPPAESKEPAERPVSPKNELGALLSEIEAKKEAGALVEAASLYREAKTLARRIGDDRLPAITEAAEALARRISLQRRARDVRAMLERHPGNVAAREGLVRLYLVNMNDPKRAAEVLEGVEDKDLKKYVPAAAKPVDEAPELACLELGEWYARLVERAPDYAKANMYARAKAYLDRFMRLHETKDLHRVRATVAMEKVEKALASLAPAATQATPSKEPTKRAGGIEDGVIKPGGWVDLLPFVDPEKDAVEGIWKRDGDRLVLENKGPHNRCMFPLATSGSYALELAFERTAGEQTFKVYLPTGSRHVMLVVAGYGGSLAGLEYINDRRVDERPNPTRFRTAALENGSVYRLRIGVRVDGDEVAITTTLGGRQVVDWKGAVSALSISGGWSLPEAGVFGVGAWKSCYAVHRMRLKMLTGEARLLRPEGAGGGASGAAGTTAAKPPGLGSTQAAATGPVVDALGTIDPDEDALTGGWQRDGEALVIHERAHEAKAVAPLHVEGSYRLEAEFVRNTGGDTVGIVLPVEDRHVVVGISHGGGQAHGLDQIRGRNGHSNETSVRPGRIENDRSYTVGAAVTVDGDRARIGVWLGKKQIIDWSGPTKDLTMYPGWRLPHAHRLGLGASNSTMRWQRLLIQPTGGRVRPLRPATKPATVPEGKAPDFFDVPAG